MGAQRFDEETGFNKFMPGMLAIALCPGSTIPTGRSPTVFSKCGDVLREHFCDRALWYRILAHFSHG
jgi:hypothetical protein